MYLFYLFIYYLFLFIRAAELNFKENHTKIFLGQEIIPTFLRSLQCNVEEAHLEEFAF